MHNFRTYVLKQLRHFDPHTLWYPNLLVEYGSTLFWWMVPAFTYVWFVSEIAQFPYLEAAILEGLGPHLWNVMSSLGIILFEFAILFPRLKCFAIGAHQILKNAHAVGALATGLLLGQLTNGLASAPANTAFWTVWLMGLGGAFVLLLVSLFNFCLWYLGYLATSTQCSVNFFDCVEKLSFRFRAGISCFSLMLVVILLSPIYR